MAILLAQLKVADYDRWKQVFESHADLRKQNGCTGTHIFYNAHDKTEVIVNLQWDSEENAQKFLQSPEAQTAIRESGVTGSPNVTFLEDGGRTPS
jgi:heme-degrading monooxygenase HmoA